MRCSCQVCGTYMVHAESVGLGCVCPDCGYRCKECLGTNTVMSREELQSIRENPILAAHLFDVREDPVEERYNPDEYGRE